MSWVFLTQGLARHEHPRCQSLRWDIDAAQPAPPKMHSVANKKGAITIAAFVFPDENATTSLTPYALDAIAYAITNTIIAPAYRAVATPGTQIYQ